MRFFNSPKGENREPASGPGPDFSQVDQQKAQELARQGVLAPLYMMPLRFGGEEALHNCLLVPPVTVALKDRCDDMVQGLLRQEKVNGYQCTPAYTGTSFVPTAITVTAKMDGKAVFTQRIQIWGDEGKEQ